MGSVALCPPALPPVQQVCMRWPVRNTPMQKLLALAAAMAVCAGPALAQADQPTRDCGMDPETTGTLADDPRSVYLPGQHPVKADRDPPEVSWQDEAQESSEQRRRDLLDCGVD